MTAFVRVAYSLTDLLAEVNERWPRRPKVSDGALGDQAHSSRVSDHNPDANGIVRARDFTEWNVGTPTEADDVAEVIAETIRHRRDPRVKYVIWSGRMFSSYESRGIPAWQWRTYTGPNGHFKHVHVSVLPDGPGDAPGPWGIWPVNTTTEPEPPSQGDFMPALTEAEQRELLEKVRATDLRVVELQAEVVAGKDGPNKDQSRMDRLVKRVDEILSIVKKEG